MGVYVKGMDMPKSCCDCDVGVYICNRYYDPNFDINDARIKRHPDCPLVEVKSPHGRLGDLDALLRYKGDCYDTDGHLLYAVGTGSIMCAPTVIEAEGKDNG